jgi:uncharacterized membrane protein
MRDKYMSAEFHFNKVEGDKQPKKLIKQPVKKESRSSVTVVDESTIDSSRVSVDLESIERLKFKVTPELQKRLILYKAKA